MSAHPDLDQLEALIQQLKMAYERYFQGMERVAPMKNRDHLDAEMKRLKPRHGNSTERRFRLAALEQKIGTYRIYWDKILRQIEDGTFTRGRFQPPTTQEIPIASAAASETPQINAAMQKLHDSYNEARAQAGLSAVPIEQLAEAVKQQAAAIRTQHNVKSVSFKVTMKDGKPVLKAVPKGSGE